MGHLSAAELAALALPGLPRSKRGVIFQAEREGWQWVERTVRGNATRCYAVADLPEAARRLLDQRRPTPAPANLRGVGRPKGSDFFARHPNVADAVEVTISEQAISATQVLALLAADGRFDELPNKRTLERFIARLHRTKPALIAAIQDPDAFKSKYRVALGRADAGLTHANQRWEIDTTKADVLTRGGRVCVLGLIDVWSRRARFLVVPSESAQSVRRLLVTTMRAWGVKPEEIGTDNGSGFINASLTTALPDLGIRLRPAPPGSPEKKPFVERLFGVFMHERAPLLPGFSGHNVAQAQRLRAKAKKETGRAEVVAELNPDELQEILDNWTEGEYGQRPHSATGQPPLLRWASAPLLSARAPSDDQLRIALSRFEGSAKVGKQGVRWKRGRYWAPALAAWMGRRVVIRRDEDDLGALFVFDEDGRFIDTAVNWERSGFSEQEFAEAARRDQAALVKRHRAEHRERKRGFTFEHARDAVLREDAAKAGKLHVLPVQTVDRSTPQLDSIAARPAPAVPDQATLDRALARTAPSARAPEIRTEQKVAEADRVIQAAADGEAVDQAELERARNYAASAQYRAHKLLTAPFGASSTSDHQRRHHA